MKGAVVVALVGVVAWPGTWALADAEGAAADAPVAAPSSPPAPPPREAGAPPAYEEEVTVRAPARLEGAPAPADPTIHVIDARELQATGARTLQEAMEHIASVHLADEQGNAFQRDVTMRGFTASPVTGLPQGLSVFLDGVRVNEPAAEEVNFDLIPLTDVERVEIVRGPRAVFGRNTLGGAILIVTRRGGAKREVDVEAEGGSSVYQSANGRVAGPLGAFDGYLSLAETTERGWRASSSSSGFHAFGKLGLRRDGTDAALSYQFQIDRLEQPGSLPPAMLREDPSQNYTPGDFFRPVLHLVTLNARQRLASSVSVAANGFFRALDTEQFNASWIAPNTRLFNATRSFGGTVQLEHRASAGALRNELLGGVEATHNSVQITVHEEPNGNFATTGDGLPLPRVTSDLSDGQLAAGAFVQDRLRVATGPLAGLAATAALRFDWIGHAIVDASPDDPGKATGNPAFSALVPEAGITWAFAPRWTASASYTQGFRAPAFLELTCADPAAPCVGLQAGVAPDTGLAKLRPVRSRTLEASVSVWPLDEVTVSLNVFRIDLHDDIYAVTAPGTTRVVFQNMGDTRRQGLELQLHGEHGIVGVDASYAYTLATFESDLSLATPRSDAGQVVRPGDQLPLAPNHRAAISCRVAALPWLGISAGLVYVGSQYFLGDEANVGPKLAPYVVLSAGVEARWRGWTAFVRTTNLLDRRYETFGTFAPDGRAPGQPIVPFLTPGPPLRGVAGLRWVLE